MTGGSQLVFNAAGTLLDVPPSNGTVSVSALKVQILQPSGSADSKNNNWTNSWIADNLYGPGFYWDFQGVSSASAGAYPLGIIGSITPDTYSYNWSANSANEIGTVFGLDGYPLHQPPATAPQDGAFGTIKLEVLLSYVPTGISDSKRVIIYKDHLARDMANFKVDQPCVNGNWETPFGKIEIENPYGYWNCHGSTLHAYDGSGNGALAHPDFLNDTNYWQTPINLSYPFNQDARLQLDHLNRGDVISYHDAGGGPIHTATATGNSAQTWGANNAPLKLIIVCYVTWPSLPVNGHPMPPQITPVYTVQDSRLWSFSTVYDCATDFATNYPKVGITVTNVLIHRLKAHNVENP